MIIMSDDAPKKKSLYGSGAPIIPDPISNLELEASDFEQIPEPITPDWNHWLKLSIVSIKEACWLLADIEPRSILEKDRFSFVEMTKFYETLQVIQSALVCNELPFIRSGKNYVDGFVKLAYFVEWAANIGYEIPEALRGAMDKKQLPNESSAENFETEQSKTEAMQKQSDIDSDKLDAREKKSLLSIIAALCEKAGTDPNQSGLARELAEITERLGITVSERTIKEHLKKAYKLPML
jgi:hypothetical protein